MFTEPEAPSAARDELPVTSQLILGADKRNPVFTVYRDRERERLQVYFGFELLETLPDVPESPACKLLVARLYNAGVKIKSLCETFDFDAKTIRRWGRSLRLGDADELIRVLEGRTHRRKRTPQMESFVRLRLPELWTQRRYGAIQRLRQEIKTVFRIEISAKSLGLLIRELNVAAPAAEASVPSDESAVRKEAEPEPSVRDSPAPALATFSSAEAAPENREIASACGSGDFAGDFEHQPNDNAQFGAEVPLPPLPDNGKLSPRLKALPPAGQWWCEHAGLLIFAAPLIQLNSQVEAAQPFLAQWLSCLLLGAQNIEQTKFLNWEDLELILGQVSHLPLAQRSQLKALSTEPILEALFLFNAQILEAGVGTDFYFDPHTKHYTGEQNVLKGWCAKLRWADKVLQSDFIHTAGGAPLYFETTDSFEDLRERFFGVIARARASLKWPAERVVTYVVDRGIFAAEVFKKVLADPRHHLITWQKDYVAEPWVPTKVSGNFKLTRVRNNSGDLRCYDFDYLDRPWAPDPRLRQIVVRATDPKGRVAQVAILTDDLRRSAQEIIALMFRRWLQENDFKYLDKHFGINQITSYRVIEYDQLRNQVKDRQIKSGQRKVGEGRRQKARRQQARLLLVQEAAEQRQRQRILRVGELQGRVDPAPDVESAAAQELKKLQLAEARHQLASQGRREQIQKLSQRLDVLTTELAAVTQDESRLEAMIAAQMVRMEPQSKRLLDTLRIIARNLFYRAIQPFKAAYDNFRDDHDYFRKLSQSAGVLEFGAQEVIVHLMPTSSYPPAMRRIVQGVLEGLNQLELRFPNGAERKLRFRLGARSELRLHLELTPQKT